MINADELLKHQLASINKHEKEILTKLGDTIARTYFRNLGHNDELASLAQSSLYLIALKLGELNESTGTGTKSPEDTTSITYT